MVLVLGLTYGLRSIITVFSLFLAAFYVHTVVRSQALGLPRVLASLPILPFHLLLPYLFQPSQGECLVTFLLSSCVVWLATFRVATFCWDQGHAAPKEYSKKFVAFFAALYFPIRAEPQAVEEKPKAGRLTLKDVWDSVLFTTFRSTLLKVVILYVLLVLQTHLKAGYPLAYATFAWGIQHTMSLMTDMFVALVKLFAPELKLLPPFQNIFKANSFKEVWGRYWNLLMTDCLRDTVYLPLVRVLTPLFEKADAETSKSNGVSQVLLESSGQQGPTKDAQEAVSSNNWLITALMGKTDAGVRRRHTASPADTHSGPPQLIATAEAAADAGTVAVPPAPLAKTKAPPRVVQMIAVMATFTVSGIMHLVNVWYRCHVIPMTIFWFFFTNGVLCCLEDVLKTNFGISFKKLIPAPWHRLAAGVAFLTIVCGWFVPVFIGLPNNNVTINEVRALFGFGPVDLLGRASWVAA